MRRPSASGLSTGEATCVQHVGFISSTKPDVRDYRLSVMHFVASFNFNYSKLRGWEKWFPSLTYTHTIYAYGHSHLLTLICS
ncbi:unnamed protein product [Protopolystoma xenopodis]|uniref:Uncharacterized protein n=1 Tax=Protopolystoma xenopodis TaxID=117903 RepID=A0A448X4E0_9PLAT|nr:unnamed protein product [Protopolystoma xenopodis]